MTGESAVEFIRQFKVDHGIVGASAINDGAMLDFDYNQVRVAKAIMQNVRSVLLVADVDTFVTDLASAEPTMDICRTCRLRLEIAGVSPSSEETFEAAQ